MRQQHQSPARIAGLRAKFSFLEETIALAMYHVDGARGTRAREPKLKIFVQRGDKYTVHKKLSCISGVGSYVQFGKDYRATRAVRIYTLDENRNPIWVEGSRRFIGPRDREVLVREVLSYSNLDKVKYIAMVASYNVCSLPRKRQERLGVTLGLQRFTEVDVAIWNQPKDMTWRQLVELADREKEENENAWKYPPRETPELLGIHRALKDGSRLHAFRSGGGLRVTRLELGDKLVGYGEHPSAEIALRHLDEDFLAGGRPYQSVYGPRYPHYLTGSSNASSNLDAWLLQGNNFDAWQESSSIVFQLSGYASPTAPTWVQEMLDDSPDLPFVLWEDSRGFVYLTQRCAYPGGTAGFSYKAIYAPKGWTPDNSFIYQMKKTGRGGNLWKAMAAAFDAPEEQIKNEHEGVLAG